MKDVMSDVVEFHRRFNLGLGREPRILSAGEWQVRAGLLKEELDELEDAYRRGNLVKIADAVLDSIFVLVGTAVALGLDLRAMWPAVAEANMAKHQPGSSDKPQKPAGWQGPEAAIAAIIEAGAVDWDDLGPSVGERS